MEAVEDISLGSATIEVEEKEIEIGIEMLDAFFDTLRYNVVGYTSEWLKANDIVDSRLSKVTDFAREEPTFAKIGSKIDDIGCKFSIVEDANKRTIERIGRTDLIVALHLVEYVAINSVGHKS